MSVCELQAIEMLMQAGDGIYLVPTEGLAGR